MRAAVLRVQLRRLPEVVRSMRSSKYRIRAFLERHPQVQLRRIMDPEGDTGAFLLVSFPDPAQARHVNARLRQHGISSRNVETSNVVLEDYGFHVYFNIPSLVRKVGTGRNGSPWLLAENKQSCYEYARGTCPRSDDLFARTQLLTIPSCLSE